MNIDLYWNFEIRQWLGLHNVRVQACFHKFHFRDDPLKINKGDAPFCNSGQEKTFSYLLSFLDICVLCMKQTSPVSFSNWYHTAIYSQEACHQIYSHFNYRSLHVILPLQHELVSFSKRIISLWFLL